MINIWITGAKGFIGRHLATHLGEQGRHISGIGHGHWSKIEAAQWNVAEWLNGEIDAVNLSELLNQSGKPDVIYHLAGSSSVGLSFINPLEDFRRTVEATARLLDWVRKQSPDAKIILVSSAAVYGAGHQTPIIEECASKPYSPYGGHKAMMELLSESYVRNFGLNSVVVRLFSVYGDGLSKQLIWDLCSKLSTGNKVTLGGSGEEVRDWIHVKDVAKLLGLFASDNGWNTPVVNGGSGLGITVREIAREVSAQWGGNAQITFNGESRPGDPTYLVADIHRLDKIGFSSDIMLSTGISSYVKWYKTYLRR
jgi:UDP-glucose 4-epimerase